MLSLLLLAQMSLSLNTGGISSLGTQDSYSIAPTVNLEVQAYLADHTVHEYSPRLNVQTSLQSLPGESISLQDITTFKTIEFESGLEQPIPGIYPHLYAGFGIATRLPGDKNPRVDAAKYFTAGVKFTTSDNSSYLYIGAGPDQRLSNDYFYQATVHIEGKVKLVNYKDAKLSLVGNAILGQYSSLVRVGIVVGI